MALLARVNDYVSGPNLDVRYYIIQFTTRVTSNSIIWAPDLISHSPVPLTKPIILERLFIDSSFVQDLQ